MTTNDYEYYLILGGTLWRISEKAKTYETFDSEKNSWESMDWLKDKLSHEVECAKHLGEKYTESEALELCKKFHTECLERIERIRNKT